MGIRERLPFFSSQERVSRQSAAPPPAPELSPDEALDDFLRRGNRGDVFSFEEPGAPADTIQQIKPYLPQGVLEEGW